MKVLISAIGSFHHAVKKLFSRNTVHSPDKFDPPRMPSGSLIKLVVGLGNPGERYDGTRHNLGFEVVDLVARQLGAEARASEPDYSLLQAVSGRREIILAKPTSYMNRSGEAVRRLLRDFQISVSELLVVVDDLNLPLGAIRLRLAGSDGGHKGLASIREAIATKEFARIRLGIGPLPEHGDAVEFVLSEFQAYEQEKKREMVAKAAEAVIFASGHRLEMTMSKYNSNPAPPEST
ncbi:MAG: aminoacyl-tRNA hydrolase [Planctomycetota bacterium]